jgi:hypothetical protein
LQGFENRFPKSVDNGAGFHNLPQPRAARIFALFVVSQVGQARIEENRFIPTFTVLRPPKCSPETFLKRILPIGPIRDFTRLDIRSGHHHFFRFNAVT